MSNFQIKLPTDTWVASSWDGYIQALKDPAFEKAKGYYHNGQFRLEITPLGHDHACDNTIISFAINLFCTLREIPLKGLTNCTYRKTGLQEAQPDLSYYIGENAQVIPWGTTIIDLGRYPSPDLVIEIASTSLADDQGQKRLLYEDLAVSEYWIVNVQKAQIIALAIADRGSRRIAESQVLPGLELALLETALQLSRQMDQTQVGGWLLTQFQP